jgi:hypothetical protein
MSSIIETYYYHIHNNVLLDDFKTAKMYLAFLREEYEDNYEQFRVLENDGRWEHLIELGNVIDNNLSLSKKYKNIVKPIDKAPKQEEVSLFKNQVDLVKAICLAKDNLKLCLSGDFDFHCCCIESETRYGRVDLVAQDKDTIYPIEVKKSGAYHDCIGQIDKYIIHFKLGLINKIYQHVIGVVISSSFDNYVLNELHKVGAVAIKYKYKGNNNIELIRL